MVLRMRIGIACLASSADNISLMRLLQGHVSFLPPGAEASFVDAKWQFRVVHLRSLIQTSGCGCYKPMRRQWGESSSLKRQSDRIYKIFNRKVNNSQKQHTQPWPGQLQQSKGEGGITAKCP